MCCVVSQSFKVLVMNNQWLIFPLPIFSSQTYKHYDTGLSPSSTLVWVTTLSSRFRWGPSQRRSQKQKQNSGWWMHWLQWKKRWDMNMSESRVFDLTKKHQGSTAEKRKEESSKVSSDTNPDNMHSMCCYSLVVQWTHEVIWLKRTGFPLAHRFEGVSQVFWLVQLVLASY